MVGAKISVGDAWMVEGRVADILFISSKTVTFKKRDFLDKSYIEETVSRDIFRMISSPWEIGCDRFPSKSDYIVIPNSLVGTTCIEFTMIEIGHNVWVSERFETTFSLTSRGFKNNKCSSKEKAIKIHVRPSEIFKLKQRLELTK